MTGRSSSLSASKEFSPVVCDGFRPAAADLGSRSESSVTEKRKLSWGAGQAGSESRSSQDPLSSAAESDQPVKLNNDQREKVNRKKTNAQDIEKSKYANQRVADQRIIDKITADQRPVY